MSSDVVVLNAFSDHAFIGVNMMSPFKDRGVLFRPVDNLPLHYIVATKNKYSDWLSLFGYSVRVSDGVVEINIPNRNKDKMLEFLNSDMVDTSKAPSVLHENYTKLVFEKFICSYYVDLYFKGFKGFCVRMDIHQANAFSVESDVENFIKSVPSLLLKTIQYAKQNGDY